MLGMLLNCSYVCLCFLWLIRINPGREEWLNLIGLSQLLKNARGQKYYICDLHFNQDGVYKNSKNKWNLRKGATPSIKYVL